MGSGRFPSVDVVGDPQPTNAPFEVTARRVNGFSALEPARIRVSFRNSSETEETVGSGLIFPISSVWCEEGPVVLIPSGGWIQQYALGADEEIVPDSPIDGCWRTKHVRFCRHDVLRWRSINAGERVRTEYAVLHYPARGGD